MELNEKTSIRLWSVLASVPVVVGFIFWLSFIAYGADKNSKDIEKLKDAKDAQYQILMDIRTDVAIIKERINKE